MKGSKGSSYGGFTGILTLIFIVLKLTGNIDWSWWWVLSPPMILVGGLLSALAVAAFFIIGYAAVKALSDRWTRRSIRALIKKSQELER